MPSNAQAAAAANDDAAPTFARAVLGGLSREPRCIPCTWLYDRRGSELFEQITTLPEYYPTRAEIRILRSRAVEIGALAGPGVELIELGSGSSHKTPLLLAALDRPARYVPIDISAQFLEESVRALQGRFPSLPMHPVAADFTNLGGLLPEGGAGACARRVVFFPGSTIGNLAPDDAVDLLRQLARLARPGGLLVLGADATQDPARLLPAYDDAQGVTAAFNKNLLVRINRELAADFDIDGFDHAARFDAHRQRIEMHLVSRCDQWVQVSGQRFHFAPGESIHTENAWKYGLLRVQSMARSAGWAQRRTWTDTQACYGVHAFECVE